MCVRGAVPTVNTTQTRRVIVAAIAMMVAAVCLAPACARTDQPTVSDGETTVPVSTTAAPPDISDTAAPLTCGDTTGRDVKDTVAGHAVIVHLPPCYDSTQSHYPVLVLIHGAGADETQWPDVGALSAADKLAVTGAIAPVIVVVPDVNRSGDAEAVDSFVVNDLLQWVDSTYRTMPDAAHRGIGGISRGGGAALRIAANRPDLFSVVGGHSPAIGSTPPDLAERLDAYDGAIWLDVGRDDSLAGSTRQLAEDLDKHGTGVTLQVNPGEHDRPYWRSQVGDYLRFYAARWR